MMTLDPFLIAMRVIEVGAQVVMALAMCVLAFEIAPRGNGKSKRGHRG